MGLTQDKPYNMPPKVIIAVELGDMAQAVECLPRNPKTLSSNPSTAKKKKKPTKNKTRD
jgi:hypothetical protein